MTTKAFGIAKAFRSHGGRGEDPRPRPASTPTPVRPKRAIRAVRRRVADPASPLTSPAAPWIRSRPASRPPRPQQAARARLPPRRKTRPAQLLPRRGTRRPRRPPPRPARHHPRQPAETPGRSHDQNKLRGIGPCVPVFIRTRYLSPNQNAEPCRICPSPSMMLSKHYHNDSMILFDMWSQVRNGGLPKCHCCTLRYIRSCFHHIPRRDQPRTATNKFRHRRNRRT